MFFKKVKYCIRRGLAQLDNLHDALFVKKNRAIFAEQFAKMNEWSQVQLVQTMASNTKKHVIVLAPHIDDETIGCGGTILKHAKNGDKITLVFVTAGANAHHDFLSKEEMASARRSEGESIARKFGATHSHFFDLEDGKLEATQANILTLHNLLASSNPDLIYLPHFVDTHPDHRAVNHLLFGCRDLIQRTEIRAYESQCLMTALLANLAVDISDVAIQKWEALKLFRSQGLNFRFVREKARIESLPFPGPEYVEVFWQGSLKEYEALYRRIGSRIDYASLHVTGNSRDITGDYGNNRNIIQRALIGSLT